MNTVELKYIQYIKKICQVVIFSLTQTKDVVISFCAMTAQSTIKLKFLILKINEKFQFLMIKFRRVTNNTFNRHDLELIYMSLKINRVNWTPVYSIVNSLYMTLFHRFALQYNLNIDFIFIFRKFDIVVEEAAIYNTLFISIGKI